METYLEVFKWEGSDIKKISEDFISFEIEYINFVFVQPFSKICKISSTRCFAVS